MRICVLVASVLLLVGCLVPRDQIQIFPTGAHIANDDVILLLPQELEQLAELAECQRTPVPLLFEHAHGSKAGIAAGFLFAYTVTQHGMFARIRWTDEGVRAACMGGWRYASPAFDAMRDQDDNVRPFRLIEVSLTNVPAIEGMAAVPVPPCPLVMFPNERTTR